MGGQEPGYQSRSVTTNPGLLPWLLALLEASLEAKATIYPHIMSLIDKKMHSIIFVCPWPYKQLVYFSSEIAKKRKNYIFQHTINPDNLDPHEYNISC